MSKKVKTSAGNDAEVTVERDGEDVTAEATEIPPILTVVHPYVVQGVGVDLPDPDDGSRLVTFQTGGGTKVQVALNKEAAEFLRERLGPKVIVKGEEDDGS